MTTDRVHAEERLLAVLAEADISPDLALTAMLLLIKRGCQSELDTHAEYCLAKYTAFKSAMERHRPVAPR